MKSRRSISSRVFIAFGSFTLLLSLLYSVISIVVAYAVEDAVLERVLSLEVQHIEQAFQEKGLMPTPRVDYIKIYPSLAQAPEVIREVLAKSPQRREIFTNSGVHYHIKYLGIDVEDRPLLVAEVTPLLVVSNVSVKILVILLIALLAGLVVSVALAWRLSQRATLPVKDLAAALKNIAGRAPPLALSHLDADEEIHYLACTMEQSLRQLQDAIQRETDFNRDVSHELRTPLTVIRNTLTLGKKRALKEADFRELDESVDKLDQIVVTLLALARAESFSMESFRLRPLMEDCILELHPLMEEHGFSVELQLDDDRSVRGNQQLVRLLISNLLSNALQHASESQLRIRLEDTQLHLENRVKQLPDSELTHAGVKNADSSGLGQGLYLVSRLVNALNWQYEIRRKDNLYSFILKPLFANQN